MKQTGVTLIELMVSIAVLAILLALAVPSFSDFRERQALRGAADNFVAAIGLAKQEAVKRDAWVRVDFKPVSATSGVCLGAKVVTTATAAASAGCNCATAPAACDVTVFPSTGSELRRVELVADSIQFDESDTGFVIDPKTAMLTDEDHAGGLQLKTTKGYQVAVNVNLLGRPIVCTPTNVAKSLPGVASC